MRKLRISLKVPKEERLAAYLELMNGIMKLTPTQLKVLELLIRENPKVCTANARKAVTKKLGFKTVSVTNNFIKVLRDKSIIIRNDHTGMYEYNPSVVVSASELKSVEFQFEDEQEDAERRNNSGDAG